MKAIFNTVDTELLKYDGETVEVVRELTDEEFYREETNPQMYKIKFSDGVTHDAFQDELTFIG